MITICLDSNQNARSSPKKYPDKVYQLVIYYIVNNYIIAYLAITHVLDILV